MTLAKLIKELKELKNRGVRESDIPTITNLCIDYQNESQNWIFEDLIYQMVSFESVMEHIEFMAKENDFRGIQDIMEGLHKAERYKDKGDYYENIDSFDVEERLNDIINTAKIFKSKNN